MGFFGDVWDYTKDALGFSKPQAIDTTGKEIAENDARRQEYASKLANYQPRTAAQMGSVGLAPTQRADVPQAPGMQQAPGTQSFAASAAQANQVNNTQVGPVHQMTAATVGPAAQAQAGQATAGAAQAQQVDTGGEIRDLQRGSLGELQQAANGTGGPSAAEQQMQRGLARNIASQYALARTAHGAGRVGALEQSQQGAEQANADVVGRTAELRANEQAQARNQYAQALQGVRGQDLGAQTTNAQLGTDVSKFNVGTQADVSKANAAEFGTTTRFNAGQQNQMGLEQARFAQDASGQNMGAQNAANIEQARINAAQNQQNAALGTDVSKFNAGETDAMNRFNEQNRQQSGQFNAQLEADRQKYIAGLQGQIGMFNAGQGNEMTRAQGQLDFGVGSQNLGAQTQWAQMDDSMKRAYLDYISASQGQSIQGALGQTKAQQEAIDSRHSGFMDLANFAKGAATGKAIG
jgi:hypothetical protein